MYHFERIKRNYFFVLEFQNLKKSLKNLTRSNGVKEIHGEFFNAFH